MLNSTWLEELASESNTIQAQEDILLARVMAGSIRQKLYVRLGWLFDHISGLMCSFEPASFVAQDIISLLLWNSAGSSRKWCEALSSSFFFKRPSGGNGGGILQSWGQVFRIFQLAIARSS